MIRAIGVAASDTDLETAEEFFELFKTPWEPAVPGRRYGAILSGDGHSVDGLNAAVLLQYGCSPHLDGDETPGRSATYLDGPVEVEWGGESFPIFGRLAVFDHGRGAATLSSQAKPVDYCLDLDGRKVWRIGYDLFAETRHLLSRGQPARFAQTPTLEFHIAVVRHVLQEAAVPFIEVQPRPAGYEFTCCLTHDLDFFGIRRHTFDRTLVGFVSRAAVGTAVDCLRGRRPVADVFRNWKALCFLPFVRLGLLPDFWSPVQDYLAGDGGRRSTFFVIPFKRHPGIGPDETVNATRAVAYEAREVRDELNRAAARGNEVALHGIDAWRDADRGRAELAQVAESGGTREAGVRMHWLYFAEQSPQTLEAAGFDYDSTWGYNEAIGFRPGTAQAFRLPRTRSLMELPLVIMDSALFFRDRMHLTAEQALHLCRGIVAHVRRFGGTLVINWHDRSLVPERLWDRSYRALLSEVEHENRVWFATAGDAVAWFRWRRSIKFAVDAAGRVDVTSAARDSGLPAACIRIHQPEPDGGSCVREISYAGNEPLTVGA
jgi:hypothetical protein